MEPLIHTSFRPLLDESAYAMEDLAGETMYGMKLATSLARASKRKLLKVSCLKLLILSDCPFTFSLVCRQVLHLQPLHRITAKTTRVAGLFHYLML